MSIYAPVKIPTLMGIQTTPPQPPVTLPEVNHIPGYVYRLTCIPTGQFYIGSRVGNITDKKMPKDDFWIHYHTSSEYVSELVNLHGKTSFEYEIIYEDCDRDKVFWHEQEQIKLHYMLLLILFSKTQLFALYSYLNRLPCAHIFLNQHEQHLLMNLFVCHIQQ